MQSKIQSQKQLKIQSQKCVLDGVFDDNIMLNITGLLTTPIDTQRLLSEIKLAEKSHPFLRRTPVWLSIAMRSANGEISEEASGTKGIYNSSDSSVYKDTIAMQPYIRSILDEIDAPILKVRILKLKAKKSIGEHADNFQSKDILRFHIPVITHPLVEFWINKERYFVPTQELSYLNVRKRHKVVNKSHINRIHIVIDVKQTQSLVERVKECCVVVDHW